MLIRPSVSILVLLVVAGSAHAQQMFRCGNTFSQTPCANDAAATRVPASGAPEKSSGLQGYELCADAAPKNVSSPEPESARVQPMGQSKMEMIQYAGKGLAAHRYDLSVDAKTQYGVYSGPRGYSCWVSEDQKRILQFGARRN